MDEHQICIEKTESDFLERFLSRYEEISQSNIPDSDKLICLDLIFSAISTEKDLVN